METNVFLLILLASILHALWNGMVKKHDDKVISVSAIVFGHVPASIIAIILLPFPGIESVPYIVASAIIHQGYQWFLLSAYQHGDFTRVYPIARGFGPIVATIVSLAVLGILLNKLIILSIFFISVGIIFNGLFSEQKIKNIKVIQYSLITGFFIGIYSLIDGYGARASLSSITYISWSFILNAFLFPLLLRFKNHQNVFKKVIQKGKTLFWFGGTISYFVYAIVVWGFTQAPIPIVGALRETSILFALFIGLFYLNEKINLNKIISISIIFLGLVGLKLF